MNLLLKFLASGCLVLLSVSLISARVIDTYTCDTNCPQNSDPYCVKFVNGTVTEFQNECKMLLDICLNNSTDKRKHSHRSDLMKHNERAMNRCPPPFDCHFMVHLITNESFKLKQNQHRTHSKKCV